MAGDIDGRIAAMLLFSWASVMAPGMTVDTASNAAQNDNAAGINSDSAPTMLFTGISNGSIVLDSVFIEYELEDASTYFVLGCPDPVTDTLIFANSGVLDEFQSYSSSWQCNGTDSFGMNLRLTYSWNMVNGVYSIYLESYAISNLGFTSDGFFSSSASTGVHSALPFPEGWFLDEGGIHIEEGYNLGDFINYANYIHILPYWHYAE